MVGQTLTEHFSRYLIDTYQNHVAGAGPVEIKFEGVGHPIVASELTDDSISRLANVIPVASSDVFVASSQELARLYEIIVNSAQMSDEFDDTAFIASKARAMKNMIKAERAPHSGLAITYHLSTFVPRDWHSNDSYWSEYKLSNQARDGAMLATAADGSGISNDFGFRAAAEVVDAIGGALAFDPSLLVAGGAGLTGKLKPVRSKLRSMAGSWLSGAMEGLFGTSKKKSSAVTESLLNAAFEKRIDAVRKTKVPPKESTTEAPELSLEYCVIKIERKWLDDSIFSVFRNWHIPNMEAGQLSREPVGLQLLPEAAIVVRDLAIRADWSEEDAQQIPKAASFGPFALGGCTWSPSSGQIESRQMQIIGWLCSRVPAIPPRSDPSAVPQHA